ncbi:MAG: hypothetical protein LAP86_15265 [Acidobacteriia bacterium]|nr:hypothetical protein [Terriglobia bacterium]
MSEALQDGRIDEEQMRALWLDALIDPGDIPIWLGIESSRIERPQAECSADRSMISMPNMPHATKPVSVGWQFSTASLGKRPSSGDCATGSSRHARHFGPTWHTGSCAQTTRKIAGMAQRPVAY